MSASTPILMGAPLGVATGWLAAIGRDASAAEGDGEAAADALGGEDAPVTTAEVEEPCVGAADGGVLGPVGADAAGLHALPSQAIAASTCMADLIRAPCMRPIAFFELLMIVLCCSMAGGRNSGFRRS